MMLLCKDGAAQQIAMMKRGCYVQNIDRNKSTFVCRPDCPAACILSNGSHRRANK
jgi:hypothetical protein